MTQQQTQGLEQTLERTDFGHFINKHKKSVIGFGVFILAFVMGYSIYLYQSNKISQERLDELYEYSTSIKKVLEPTLPMNAKPGKDGAPVEEKLTIENANELLSILEKVPAHLAKLPSAVPMVMNVVNEIESAGYDLDLIPTMEKYIKHFSPKESIYLFPALKLAVMYENTDRPDEAIAVLEKLVAAGTKVMEAKIYLDLGRLYLTKDQTDKARANFEYIVKNYSNTEYSKLANLYLLEM